MAVSTRLRGNQGLILTLKKGAATATSFADDVKKWELTPEDADSNDITFAEAMAGLAAKWTLKLTAITSADTTSLFAFLWDNAGQDVEVVLGPYGNATATPTKPHYKFTANLGLKPGLQNEARTEKTGAEFEKELEVIGDVLKVTA